MTILSAAVSAARMTAQIAGAVGEINQVISGGNRAEATLEGISNSAKVVSAEVQKLPGKFAELFGAIQSGQASAGTFLKFGVDLVQSFGGVGAAARGVMSLVNPFNAAVQGAILLTDAYKEGSKEADHYAKVIALTGNAAGTSIPQLQTMAEGVSHVVGTQAKAAEVLAALAGTGQVASGDLEKFATTAIQMERNVGVSVADTVKHFAELGASPVEASQKLNAQYGYLTASVYSQIKALKEQGDTLGAAGLAQQTYEKAMANVSKTMEGRLGFFERAWRSLGDTAAWAWDKMLNIGREETAQQKLASVSSRIDTLKDQVAKGEGGFADNGGGAATGGIKSGFQKRRQTDLAALQQDQANLQEEIRLDKRGAEAKAQRLHEQSEAQKAEDVALALQEKGLSRNLQRQKAIKEYEKRIEAIRKGDNPSSEALTPKAIAQGYKAIDEQFAEKRGGGSAAAPIAIPDSEAFKQYTKSMAEFSTIAAGAVVQTENLSKTQAELRSIQGSPVWVTYSRQQQEQIILAASLAQTGEDSVEAAKEQAKAAQESKKALDDAAEAQRQQTIAAVTAAVQAETELANYGLLKSQVQALTLARLEDARDAARLGGEDVSNIDKRIEAQKRLVAATKGVEAAAAKAQVTKEQEQEWTRVSGSIEKSLTDAFVNSFATGKSLAKGLREALKEQFSSLVLRPTINAVMKPIAGVLTGALGLAETASAGTSAASSLGSLASGASLLGSASTFGAGIANGLSAWSAGGSVMGVLSNPGLYTIAELAGVLGPIALGIAALVAISQETKGELRSGGQFGIAYGGSVTNQRRGQTYTYEGQQYDRDFSNGEKKALVNGQAYRLEGDPVSDESTIKKAITGTATSINDLLKMYGSRSTLTSFSAGFETSGKSRGGVFAGGILSTGERFGESGQGDNYSQTLYELTSTNSPDFKTAVENFTTDLQQATLQALKSATDLPKYVSRQLKDVDIEALGATETTALLSKIGDLPNQLLQSFGTSRDALVQQFVQGLAGGDAAAAGETVANTLVASIEQTLFTTAAGRIFDTVNAGIIAPMLDAITTGANISEVLSQESIDRTIARAQEQAEAVTLLFNSPDFISAMERIRTTVGGALGQAGSGVNYTPRYQAVAAAPAASGSSGTPAPSELTRTYENAVKSLKSGSQDLGVELLSARGDEEGAKSLQKSLDRTRFMEQFEAFEEKLDDTRRKQIETLYDANEATRAYIQGIKDAAQAQLDSLTRQRDSAVQMIDTATGNTDAAFERFEAATNKERERLQLVIDAARSVFDAAKDAVSSLFGEVESAVLSDGLKGRDFISVALAEAQTTGKLPDGEKLSEAIGAVGKDLAATTYASQAEGDYQRLVLANELKGLQDISGDQLTEAERQAEKLDKDLEQGREMISAMRGIDTSVGTLSETLVALIGAYNQESRIRSNVAAQGALGKDGAYYNYQTGTGLNSSGVYFEGAAIREAAAIALDQGATAKDIYDVIAGSGFSLAQAEAILGATPGSFEDIAKQMDWPIFHRGTRSVPRTGFALLQQGEAVIPAAYNPFTAGRGWNNSNDMLSAMEGVRAELIEVRRQNDALQRSASRTADAVNGRPEAPMLVENV